MMFICPVHCPLARAMYMGESIARVNLVYSSNNANVIHRQLSPSSNRQAFIE